MVEYLATLAVHFIGVFVGVVLFFTPFVAVFWYRNRHEIRDKQPHFNQFAEQFFMSRESNALILAWGAAEAFFWFVLPEFLLFLVIFLKVRHKFDLLKYDLIGTAIGTIIAMLWHAQDAVLVQLPYVYQGMIDQVRIWFEEWGIWGLIFQPFSGVPFKVFNHIAPEFGFFFVFYIVIAISVRMARYFIAYEVLKAVYPVTHKFVRKHYGILFIVAVIVFTMLLMRVSQIYS